MINHVDTWSDFQKVQEALNKKMLELALVRHVYQELEHWKSEPDVTSEALAALQDISESIESLEYQVSLIRSEYQRLLHADLE